MNLEAALARPPGRKSPAVVAVVISVPTSAYVSLSLLRKTIVPCSTRVRPSATRASIDSRPARMIAPPDRRFWGSSPARSTAAGVGSVASATPPGRHPVDHIEVVFALIPPGPTHHDLLGRGHLGP